MNYIEVRDRLQMALAKYPDLRVVESLPRILEVGGRIFIEVRVTVYRSADDTSPNIASAWEPFPGKTNFTRDSEMMNCSTSALGRALGYMGFGISRSMASADEVRNRRGHEQRPRPESAVDPAEEADPTRAIPRPTSSGPLPASDSQKAFIRKLAVERGEDVQTDGLTARDASRLIDELKAKEPIK